MVPFLAAVVLAAFAPAPQLEAVPVPHLPPPPDQLRPALQDLMARRAYLDSLSAGFEPFDLTYLTREPKEVQALVAVRPAALFAHPDLKPFGPELDGTLAMMAGYMGFGTGGPGLAAIDTMVLPGHITVGANADPGTKAEKPSQFMVGGTAAVIRTVRPYDWNAAVRRWFPFAAPAEHAGERFLCVRFKTALFPVLTAFFAGMKDVDELAVAFYAPDDRTLVVDGDEAIRRMIDRRKAGRAVEPPPGWDKVSRGVLAVAFDNRNKQWVANLPPDPAPYGPDPGIELFRAADHLAVGLEVGPVVRVRVSATCPTPFAAKKARQAARYEFARVARRAVLMPGDDDPDFAELERLIERLMADGTFTPTALGFEYVGEVRGDPARPVGRLAARPKPAVTFGSAQVTPASAAEPVKPGHEGLPPLPSADGTTPAPPTTDKPGHAGLPPIPPSLPKGDWYDLSPKLPPATPTGIPK